MRRFERIVILTGAGISKESGLHTFRDPDGIWAKYDYREVATDDGFARNPGLVHDFYNQRRRALSGVVPNPAHLALARLEREHRGHVTLVTQNIDRLHEAAGSLSPIHMHGELESALCMGCGARHAATADLSVATRCPACGGAGKVRPDVVWFGEMPYYMDEITRHLAAAHLFISIGTSGHVYPAAGFVAEARAQGAHTVELNLEPSEGCSLFAEARYGPATVIVPAYVETLLTAGP